MIPDLGPPPAAWSIEPILRNGRPADFAVIYPEAPRAADKDHRETYEREPRQETRP